MRSYFFAIWWASKVFSTVFFAFLARRSRRGFDEMSFLIAWARSFSFSVGTNRPVLLFSMISGIPPALVAMIGRFEIIASRLTRPNASLVDGRTKKSALFMSCGMFLRRPRRMTWFWRLRFSMSFCRASR